MKRPVLLFSILLSSNSVAEWYTYHGVSFLADGLNAWVVPFNRFPHIMHTGDGGQTWEVQESGTSYQMYGVFFLNDTLGWTVGNLAEIRQTTDGGANWCPQSAGLTYWLTRVHFIDHNRGWAVGREGVVVRTADGGSTWELIFLPVSHTDCRGVSFADSMNGWVAGASDPRWNSHIGCVLHTEDGGSCWTSQLTDSFDYDFLDVQFVNANEGWVVGGHRSTDKPIILHSGDGGAIWDTQFVDTGSYLTGVEFVSETEGWASGKSGTILHTTNGGTSWELQESGVTVTLFDIDFASPLRGIAVGDSSTILVTWDGGENWNPTGVQENHGLRIGDCSPLQTHPNPFNKEVAIMYELPRKATVFLKIHDITGRTVKTLVNKEKEPGKHSVTFDAEGLATGVYFAKLAVGGNHRETRKLILVR